MSIQIAEFALQGERDVSWAAQRARLLGSLAGLAQRRRTAFGKAVREIADHVVVHAGSGTITFGLAEQDGRYLVEAVVRDHGAGLQRLSRVRPDAADTDRQIASQDVEQLVDLFSIEVDSQGGTAVTLCVALPAAAEQMVGSATDWGTVLATRTTEGALSTSQKRIRELAASLEKTQRRGVDLEAELKQIKSLNETLELLALVASKTDNAVVIMDEAGVVEWVNDGFVRITGFDLSDVRGQPVVDVLLGPVTGQEDTRDIQNAIRSGHGISREIPNSRKDGTSYWAAVSITPVFNEEGNTTRWIGIANDVTRRRREQEELKQAKEAAEAANRSKSRFLANMSHEIRTPMNAVIGMTELVLDTSLSAEQREHLTTAKESAESLLSLLNDLLDLSKIEAGRLELESAPFDPRRTVSDACKPFVSQAKKRKLDLRWEVASDIPSTVVGDQIRLRQILLNLIGNAMKFTEMGGVAVRVLAQEKNSEQVTMRFCVCDTGVGIAREKLTRIFDAFTQADSSTTRRFGGTGLGLAISAQLVDMMGGRIWVESEPGEGSIFHVSLSFPLTDETAEPPADRRSAPALAEVPPRHLHVLVADDNPANRTLAARILEKRGHQIFQVGNGKEVIDAIEGQAFDVALMDVQMPEMDGFESTKTIRQREQSAGGHLPIIAMTAYAMKGDRDRCLAAGMDAYISKPLRATELQSLVENLASSESSSPAEDALPASGQLDFNAALQRLEGDVDMFREQIAFFLAGSPDVVATIRGAIARGNAEQLHFAAHRLKGTASAFDAHALVDAADQLERMGEAGSLSNAPAIGEQLELHYSDLRRALQRFLADTS